jgi:hypothetical protein
MSAHTCIGKHATSLRKNGHVHTLCHTILLRILWDGVVLDNAFIAIVIIKFV